MFLYIYNENNYMYYKYGCFYNIFNLKVNWLRVVLECKIKGGDFRGVICNLKY